MKSVKSDARMKDGVAAHAFKERPFLYGTAQASETQN